MASRNESSDKSLVTPDGSSDDEVRTEREAPSAEAGDEPTAEPALAVRAVTEQARSARPQRKQPTSVEVQGKGVATPKASARPRETRPRGTTPAQFVNESVDELKKVVWPTPTEVRRYFVAVLVFVVVLIVFVGLLDLAFGGLLLRLFG